MSSMSVDDDRAADFTTQKPRPKRRRPQSPEVTDAKTGRPSSARPASSESSGTGYKYCDQKTVSGGNNNFYVDCIFHDSHDTYYADGRKAEPTPVKDGTVETSSAPTVESASAPTTVGAATPTQVPVSSQLPSTSSGATGPLPSTSSGATGPLPSTSSGATGPKAPTRDPRFGPGRVLHNDDDDDDDL